MSTVDVQLSFSRARNIVGGVIGSLPYQNATSATLFIPIGANSTVLQSNGTTATWATLGSLTAGAASQVNTIQRTTNASHYLTFVDSDNATATAESIYTTSSFVINPSTGNLGVGTTSPTTKLDVKQSGANWYDGVKVVRSTNDNQRLVLGNTNGASWIASIDAAAGNNNQLIFGRSTDGTTFTESGRFDSSGNLGLGTTTPLSVLHVVGTTRITGITTVTNTTNAISTVTGALQVVGGVGIGQDVWIGGGIYATTKSFVIEHPTKPGMKLRYGSLEGPENGVYVRGRLNGSNIIELPDYWIKLIDLDSITINLTPIGNHQNLYVKDIIDNTVIIGNSNLLNKEINCFYTIFAERRDVGKLEVEF